MDNSTDDTQENKVLYIVGDKCIKIESGLAKIVISVTRLPPCNSG